MWISITLIILIAITALQCSNTSPKKEMVTKLMDISLNDTAQNIYRCKLYMLIWQNYFLYHLKTSTSTLMTLTIVHVQEHYKPIDRGLQALVKAVTANVKVRAETKISIPDASTTLKLMPNLHDNGHNLLTEQS